MNEIFIIKGKNTKYNVIFGFVYSFLFFLNSYIIYLLLNLSLDYDKYKENIKEFNFLGSIMIFLDIDTDLI